MGITDKVTGRVKQAAGDLMGHEGLKGEGAREERKGEEKEELARQEARLEQREEQAQARVQDAQEQADRVAERETSRLAAEEGRVDAQADEVDRLDRTT